MASVLCRTDALIGNLDAPGDCYLMRKVLSSIAAVLVVLTSLAAQNTVAAGSERKISSRVAPNYPELARKMRLQGVVKIEAVVKPNGTVKSTRVLGGNPVLVNAAMEAVNRWRFEPAQSETTEVVQLTFTPQ